MFQENTSSELYGRRFWIAFYQGIL